MAVGTHDLQIK